MTPLVMLAENPAGYVLLVLGLLLLGSMFAAWATHWIWFIRRCRGGNIDARVFSLGVSGILLPIVGIIHGYAIWLGARVT